MTNQIVVVNVSQTLAPTPSKLQQTGALISQGGTTTAPGTKSLLTQLADLTPLLGATRTNSSLTWSASVATVTSAVAIGLANGDTFYVTIAGATPSGYNGTFLATVTGASVFTYPLTTNPGSSPASPAGTWIPTDVAGLTARATTFFAQGSTRSVYVLELGLGNAADGVTALNNYITANPNTFYSYLVPRPWSAESTFITMAANYEALNAKTYFFTTMTLQNYGNFAATLKSIVGMIEAPQQSVYSSNLCTASTYSGGFVTFTTTSAHNVAIGTWFQIAGATPAGYNGWFLATTGTTGSTLVAAVPSALGSISVEGSLVASSSSESAPPSTEFSLAADFQHTLNYDPSSTNLVAPNAFSYQLGVTPFSTVGNATILTTLKTAAVNVIGTGAEGGISNTILLWGTTMDGRDFTYWYSVDWVQINLDLNLANEVINGSNNPQAPLYYNQNGINRLQARAGRTMSQAISAGLALGKLVYTTLDPATFTANVEAGLYAGNVVVNAVPFPTYTLANPSDFSIGKYGGISIVYSPDRGFTQIIVNVNVTDIVGG